MKLKPTACTLVEGTPVFSCLFGILNWCLLVRQLVPVVCVCGGGVLGVHICLKSMDFFSENNDSLSVWITTNNYSPILTAITDICRHYESAWVSSPHTYDDYRREKVDGAAGDFHLLMEQFVQIWRYLQLTNGQTALGHLGLSSLITWLTFKLNRACFKGHAWTVGRNVWVN